MSLAVKSQDESLLCEGQNRVAFEHFHASLKRLGGESTVFRLQLIHPEHIFDELQIRLKAMFSAPDIVVGCDHKNALIAIMGLHFASHESLIVDIKRVLDLPYQTSLGSDPVDINIHAAPFSGKAPLDLDGLCRDLGLTPDVLLNAYKAPNAPKVLARNSSAQHSSVNWSAETILMMLNERRLELDYQPIVEAKTGALHHHEALMRIIDLNGARRSAGSFIMAAETQGLAHLIDHRALELCALKLREDKHIRLAVNVSAETVKTLESAKAYLTALRALGPDTRRVTLELTETAALEDLATACYFSEKARSLGCEFAIDDFGAGHTSFKNLMAVEADAIKIDAEFVSGISKHSYKQAFVRMITDLAQIFAIHTVAEGVETEADAEYLQALGVDYFQGYLFGAPHPQPCSPKVCAKTA